MKALVIYDNIGSALKATNSLRNVSSGSATPGEWAIHLWRVNMMRFPSCADEALKEALDADLIVFAGCRAYSVPTWLRDWLERWVARRNVPDAALAVVNESDSDAMPPSQTAELSHFAERHGLAFIANYKPGGLDKNILMPREPRPLPPPRLLL